MSTSALPVMPEGWPYTKPNGERRIHWESHRDKFEQMWRDGVHASEMADYFEVSEQTVYGKASQWKLGRRTARGKKKKRKIGHSRWKTPGDATNQRRMPGIVHKEGKTPKIVLESHHPASRIGTTFFPSTVVPASKLVRLLKSGQNSRKIGSLVSKGRWVGMRIFTLTLVERETCPRSCREWARCYGNNMHLAQRIHDDGTLTRRLWAELAQLNAEFPAGFVVRLHVLGDFFSTEYVDFWRQALVDFPGLRVFGFTARLPPDPIGNALVLLVAAEQDRFRLRFSGAGYETDSSEVVDRPDQVTGIRCPAETDASRSCATCGLCWQTNKTISFVAH